MKPTRLLLTAAAVACSLVTLACGFRQKPPTGKYADPLGLKPGDVCMVESLGKKYAPLCRDEATLLKLSDAQLSGRMAEVSELLKTGDVTAILATDRVKCVDVKDRTVEVMVSDGESFGRTGVVWIGMLKRAAGAKGPERDAIKPVAPPVGAGEPADKPAPPRKADPEPEPKPAVEPKPSPPPVKPEPEPPSPKPVVKITPAKGGTVYLAASKLALTQAGNAELRAKWVKDGTLIALTEPTDVEMVSRDKEYAEVRHAGKVYVVETRHLPGQSK